MEKEYVDEKFCEHCQKDTQHKFTDYGHERDSSQDKFECLICHWWGTGYDDEYSEPTNYE